LDADFGLVQLHIGIDPDVFGLRAHPAHDHLLPPGQLFKIGMFQHQPDRDLSSQRPRLFEYVPPYTGQLRDPAANRLHDFLLRAPALAAVGQAHKADALVDLARAGAAQSNG
jgi:hypothetical protein